ncbi:hypothetical protein VKT23_012936 [Stygiomarasmius scandens]|uniref:Uncharacterized protein n=1 Tax=Marasmiellus scandens TaxID=2682957 RepID=A0ABR1J841_9AGAR
METIKELFRTPNELAKFAAAFENPERIASVLKAFPSSQDLDRAVFLTKKGWLRSARSSLNIIFESLDSPRISPTQRQTQESTTTNEAFVDDPLSISEGDGDEAFDQLAALLREFDSSSITPTFMPPTLEPHYISLEGDVSTFCVVKIIIPVIMVMNALLVYRKRKERLSLRSQAMAKGSKTYVDHMIMLHYGDGDFKGSPIVIHEEKIYGAMADWQRWMHFQDDEYYVLGNRFPNLRKMIPQIRKYVFQHKVVYTMMSDAELHVGAIWGRCKEWSSGKNSKMVPEYGYSGHRKKARHACRVIVGHTFSADDRRKWTGRQVLALLCFLALKDLSML